MEDISASVDGLIISLRRADADLSAVMHRLESEFQHRFTKEVLRYTIDETEGSLHQLVRKMTMMITTCAGESPEDHAKAERTVQASDIPADK